MSDFRYQCIPIIKQIIVDTINKPDAEIVQALEAAIPRAFCKLAPAMKVWRAEVARLRLEFYKHRKFK